MNKRMTDGQIDEYLASIRKWPKRPSDYDATTEQIIRRYLRGEIEIGSSGDRGGGEQEPASVDSRAKAGEVGAVPQPTAQALREPELPLDWKAQDFRANYDTALHAMAHKDDIVTDPPPEQGHRCVPRYE